VTLSTFQFTGFKFQTVVSKVLIFPDFIDVFYWLLITIFCTILVLCSMILLLVTYVLFFPILG